MNSLEGPSFQARSKVFRSTWFNSNLHSPSLHVIRALLRDRLSGVNYFFDELAPGTQVSVRARERFSTSLRRRGQSQLARPIATATGTRKHGRKLQLASKEDQG